ncbi:hypothetical protein SAMN02745117_00110 [Lampropedia hyalina DSM 16112]|uniref:Copper(I)-binding protein n=1 Tax=Lampropedia hyalina DSM 16112 TaxID=1122156 RepID=A0A1M4SGJ4_9BURK|nr:copper chaperone PCu(A)C [Lampropedia hyalina]SHE31321.1 hypothetical protein SAMN02745117_00110 [Lampropedia hyalina DSM 16112]
MFTFQRWKTALLGSFFLAAAAAVQAHGFNVGDLAISHPHARPSLPGVPNTAAWFGVQNQGKTDDRLISARAAIASRTEIHDMKIENDIMRMFQVEGIDIPAGQSIKLGDGNKLHIMLFGLQQPLSVGDKFPLTLQFEKAGTVDVEVWVEAPRKSGDAAAEHDHHQHNDTAPAAQ